MRAHIVRNAKENILQLYGLEETLKTERIQQIEYLLDNDRFTCAEDAYEVRTSPLSVALLTQGEQNCGKRFLASQIPQFIHHYFFIRTRVTLGWGKDPKTRIKSINATFISFICCAFYWALKLQLESDKAGAKKNDPFVPDVGRSMFPSVITTRRAVLTSQVTLCDIKPHGRRYQIKGATPTNPVPGRRC
jgi:Domain of unknown function (DUF6532)